MLHTVIAHKRGLPSSEVPEVSRTILPRRNKCDQMFTLVGQPWIKFCTVRKRSYSGTRPTKMPVGIEHVIQVG